ncbi:hypothetical protein [Kribbella sandramycini]
MAHPGMTSKRLAATAFAVNLVVCGAVGAGLLVLRAPDDAAASEPTPTASTPTASETPSTRPSTEPSSEQPTVSKPTAPSTTPTSTGAIGVSGPGGIVTSIPKGWQGKPRANGTDAQANDPAEPTSFLRYGGSPSPTRPLLQVMQQAEAGFRGNYPGYKLIALRSQSWRQHEAVNWEFEFDTADGRKHVNSMYWRAGQNDYVIYASSLVANWPKMQAIYATAIDTASP